MSIGPAGRLRGLARVLKAHASSSEGLGVNRRPRLTHHRRANVTRWAIEADLAKRGIGLVIARSWTPQAHQQADADHLV
jgi:hypothetical protein